MAENSSSNGGGGGNNNNQQSGFMQGLAGHAEYVKGTAESAIGNITGSQAWTTSGEQDKAHAQSTMKHAAEDRDPSTQGYGKAEEVAGKAFGCGGMQKEGESSAKKE